MSPLRRTATRRAAGACTMILLATSAYAQVPDSAGKPTPTDTARVKHADRRARQHVLANAAVIHWYDVAIVLAGGVALSAVDEPVQRYTQRHRSAGLENVAKAFRHEGEPVFYAGISLGVLATGVLTGNADIQRAGGRLVASVGVAGVSLEGAKYLVGRSRPNDGVGAFSFHPFTSIHDTAGFETRGSMPSGHVAAAFAVATSLSDDIHSTPVHILLYTLAIGTAFSRVYENRHWVSDVAMGAALGISSAKLVSGRWRIFHLRPPGFLVTPTGAPALGFNVRFEFRQAAGCWHSPAAALSCIQTQ